MSHYMPDKMKFIGQASFTWMEIVSLRKYCKLCFKIHYVKVFRSFLSSFFWKRRKKANQRKKKKQVRPFPENSLKKHERILGTSDCRECSRKCVFSFKFENNGWKIPKVCYVSRKSGLKSQADRSVRKADSAGRLDSYVSSNKAMGIGFQRKGTEPQPPLSFGRPFGSFPAMRKGT